MLRCLLPRAPLPRTTLNTSTILAVMSNQMSYSAALSGTNNTSNDKAGRRSLAGPARTKSPKPSMPPPTPEEKARFDDEEAQERIARRQSATTADQRQRGPKRPRSHQDSTRPIQPATRLSSPSRSKQPQDSKNTSPRRQNTTQTTSGLGGTNQDSGGYTAAEYERREEYKPKTAEGQEEDV